MFFETLQARLFFILQVNNSVSIVPNENEAKEKPTGRGSSADFLDQVEEYVKSHDIVVKAPQGFLQGASFKMSPRNLDQNELTMSVKLPTDDESNAFEDRGEWTENFDNLLIKWPRAGHMP